MTNLLKGITTKLRETYRFPDTSTSSLPLLKILKENDDMFPGVGSSTFDEHNIISGLKPLLSLSGLACFYRI